MGLGGVAIAVLPSMIYPKQPFSDGLGGKFASLKFLSYLCNYNGHYNFNCI